MIIVLNRNIRPDQKDHIIDVLQTHGYRIKEIVGEEETILGAVGTASMDVRDVELLSGVTRVIPISKPYKLASREIQKSDTVVSVGSVKIGGPRIAVMAGPCAIESREQIMTIAEKVSGSGAVILRGGAYKPRTSPYSFQGLGEEGLRYLKEAGEKYGMPVVSEIVSTGTADMMKDYVDLFQIGARNMQNFELLKVVGALHMPVILKRGLSATIQEWLMAAEYLLAHGTEDVILCERGIRTFETYTRNTLDISAIPVVHKLSHLPVIIDPSHATGIRDKVPPMALASVAAGADGLILEVHHEPDKAASDGAQSLYPEQFEKLMRDLDALSPVVGKEIARLPDKTAAISTCGGAAPIVAGKVTVAFQGEHGAFSETAGNLYFPEPVCIPCPAFKAVFEAVLTGKTRYGIVPMENSLAGSIHENYDLLLQYPDVKILGEQKVRIEHNLIGVPGATIEGLTRVYSHPQALAQSVAFLDTLEGVERVPFYDTAGSVAHIAKEGRSDWAGIAAARAAETYGMEILRHGIETNPRNYTRFFVIGRREEPDVLDPRQASLVFGVPDRPGSLIQCLKYMADHQLNMKKLESRPILGKPWEYMFYVDFELPGSTAPLDALLADLERDAEDVRVLGVYKA